MAKAQIKYEVKIKFHMRVGNGLTFPLKGERFYGNLKSAEAFMESVEKFFTAIAIDKETYTITLDKLYFERLRFVDS